MVTGKLVCITFPFYGALITTNVDNNDIRRSRSSLFPSLDLRLSALQIGIILVTSCRTAARPHSPSARSFYFTWVFILIKTNTTRHPMREVEMDARHTEVGSVDVVDRSCHDTQFPPSPQRSFPTTASPHVSAHSPPAI